MKSLKEIMEERWARYWSFQPKARRLEQLAKERKWAEAEERSKNNFYFLIAAFIVLTGILKVIFNF